MTDHLPTTTASAPSTCAVCHRGARYSAARGDQMAPLCALHFVRSRTVVRRAGATALVVGTILTALNQGDLLIAGEATAAMWWKIPLTYLVPFCVTVWGALTRPA